MLALILFTASTFAQTPNDKPIAGFTAAAAAKEHALEAQLDSRMNRDDLRNWMQRLTAHPHHLGSSYDRQNQEFILSLYKSWGWDAHLEEFSVLFPTPKRRLVELIAPEKYTAKLFEPALPQDATSGQSNEQLPVYNAYSADGDVTGDLVYVNYGVPDDYEQVREQALKDIQEPDFAARWTYLTAWGTRADGELPLPIPPK